MVRALLAAVSLATATAMAAGLGGPVAVAAGQTTQSGKSAAASTRTTLVTVRESDEPPPGRVRSSREVIRSALADPKMRRLRRENPDSYVRAYVVHAGGNAADGLAGWQVSVFRPRPGRDDEIGLVTVDDATGEAVEAWTGFQVEWSMARGYPGAFGRKANALYVWLPLLLLFLAPFLRPPLRLLHLDLAVLCAFSISYAVFGTGRIGVSVPLVYPCLVYLLVRMLLLARARSAAADDRADAFHVKRGGRPTELLTPPGFLTMGIIFLIGFRVGLNVSASNVIDVGYSGVIGADLLSGGDTLYGGFPADNPRGDTYGPVNYLAYVPFELLMPWKGVWDDLPAAHAAAVAFDLAAAALMWVAGRRLRGPRLGLLLAYLWLAFPFTLLVANSGANDSLVAVLVLAALLLAGRPVARGVAVAAAGLTKFAPLLLGPLIATFPSAPTSSSADGKPPRPLRRMALTAAAFGLTAAVLLLPAWLGEGGIATFYDRTIAFQADRPSPFSVWGYVEGDLDLLQRILELAVISLAIALAFLPRRRDLITLAALCAAVLLAAQLVVTHWFYLYIVWFLPLVLVALLGDLEEPGPDSDPDVGPGPDPGPEVAAA